ncbi:response regulator transcription factor [Marinivivus vitaminiproducens]|uniref:response regulator transcription factor n=1 Tax=Marinivivus vitaminiproducens TaxID=3035935 RepID=UPI00279E6345|nr:response regulator transcription factor [Geminicoccaceae bacterium SCSIO 64248]
MTDILVVEDEARLRSDLVDYLALCGFTVESVATAQGLLDVLASGDLPTITILDVGLPDGNGFDLAAEMRRTHRCGIIMLTALGDSDDRIRGFESGADIYLVKHSTLREIEAAVRSLMRRMGSERGTAAKGDDHWVLDSRNWVLTAPNQRSLKLTATEFAFVSIVWSRQGNVCQREDVLQALARHRAQFDSRHLDAVVSRLRRKIEERLELQLPIKVVYGVGYTVTALATVR